MIQSFAFSLRHCLALLGMVAALCSHGAHALEVVDGVEGRNAFVKISAKEMTRVAIEGAKIRRVLVADGEVTLEKDDERGQIFLRPIVLDKPINMRVISATGRTYSLVMQPVNMVQEDVIIREPVAKPAETAAATVARSEPFRKQIRSLMLAMAKNAKQPGVESKPVNREVRLWEGTRLTLVSEFTDGGVTGEVYQLQNTSLTSLRVVEEEFFRDDVDVIAVEAQSLSPGQATRVFVIKGAR